MIKRSYLHIYFMQLTVCELGDGSVNFVEVSLWKEVWNLEQNLFNCIFKRFRKIWKFQRFSKFWNFSTKKFKNNPLILFDLINSKLTQYESSEHSAPTIRWKSILSIELSLCLQTIVLKMYYGVIISRTVAELHLNTFESDIYCLYYSSCLCITPLHLV